MTDAHPPSARDHRADHTRVVIIGSGFGGAVVARRLAQANRALDHPLGIVLLERGRRYESEDFPRIQLPDYLTDDAATSSSKRLPEAARLAWTYDQGLWQIRDLRGLRVAVAAGYGGGSLIYGGVHLRPPVKALDSWPGGYSRSDLDPYYQLAEAMLDVKPVPEPSRWIKTDRMQQTAKQLKREDSFFRPPIAVTFDDEPTDPTGKRVTRDNGFGVQQSGCIGCGDCIIGCPHGAKNTLDHNYLAGIEEMGIEVRTLSEAIRLERIAPDDEERGRFRVVYRDHLKGGQENTIPAEYVFVCAGAIGSTELLLRSSTLEHNGEVTGLAALGQRFFANGDAPGVIFGTTQPWEPSSGPTITTSMYYEEQGQWFLLQEGAIPATLQRGLGFLQSPLWFKRNAFGRKSPSPSTPAPAQTLAGLQALSHTLLSVPRVSRRLAAAGRADAVVDPQLSALVSSVPGVSRALTVAALGHAAPQDSSVLELLPKSLRTLVETIEPPGEMFRRHITSIDRGVVDQVAEGYRDGIPLFGALLASAVTFIGRSPRVVDATIAELVRRFAALATVRDSTSAPMLGIHTLLDLVLGPAPTESTAILLAMGPDSQWTLALNSHSRQLQAAGDTAANVALYGMQERLMRDIAQSLGGELRTNPGWTLGKNPLTVHAQGGCSMGNGSAGVTDPDGLMVRGIDGLYVFDASVFPQSVGVNPSSTIAAVAERNIERFIRTILAEHAPVLKDWTAVRAEEETFPAFAQRLTLKQRQWEDGPGSVLDQPKTPEAATRDVPGLVFDEVMEGFIGEVPGKPPALGPADLAAGAFRELERKGQRRLQRMRLDLNARILDLDRALLHSDRFKFNLGGHVRISWAGSQRMPPSAYQLDSGTLEVDLRAPNRVGTMSYWLEATSVTNPLDRIELNGVKQLRDDPGLDAWTDLTTLYVLVERHTPHEPGAYGGIVHVPLLDFIGTQLPSMDVIGDDMSAERKSWLLLRFVQHFFKGLDRIYAIGEL